METVKNENLQFQELTAEEKAARGILGRLFGPCADVINPTRNDRKYSEELWEKVFQDPIVKEMLEKGGIPGELDHPEDRTEIDSSKIAIIMPEAPKKNEKGQLVAYFDILDTPNGRIAYQLAKYGFKLGVSSRGNGDVYESYDGGDVVDPDTYEFKCFDLVLCPSVKTARLTLQESNGNKTFKQAIRESLRTATKDERKVMEESLKKLNIDYKQERKKKEPADDTKVVTESVVNGVITVAEDNGAAALVQELQREIKKSKELTEQNASLQEKLSVCYAKEVKYEEAIQSAKEEGRQEAIAEVDSLKSKITALTERLETQDKVVSKYRTRIRQLTESRKSEETSKTALTESLTSKDGEISKLKESLRTERLNARKEKQSLTEQLEEVKKNSQIKTTEYNSKITKANKIVESYKKIADNALNKYMELKAVTVGCSVKDIKSRLTEKYSFEDIDRVCESLQQYKVVQNRLPINLGSSKVKVTESIEPIKPVRHYDGDDVDDSLLRMAGLD